MSRPALILASAAAALATVAAGCGGSSSPSWKPLPKAPVAGRIGEGVVWTGKELIVWGGLLRTGTIRPASDGAAYNPVTRAWRTLAPAPHGVLGVVGNGAAWSGRRAVFWAGNSPDGPAVGAVYDPATDTWKRLPAGPLGPREGYASVWTGKELLLIGGTSGDGLASPNAAAVNPATGSWRLLRGLNAITGLLANGAVWDGQEAFVTGRQSLCPQQGSSCQRFRPIFVAYDPATDAVRELNVHAAPVGARQLEQLVPIAWTGGEVLLATSGNPGTGLIGYDPNSGTWSAGRSAPCAVGGTQTAWLGDQFAVPCGADGLQVYRPSTNVWEQTRPGRSPFNSREGSAIAWTGTSLIAWSGAVSKPLNPTPDDGASLTPKR